MRPWRCDTSGQDTDGRMIQYQSPSGEDVCVSLGPDSSLRMMLRGSLLRNGWVSGLVRGEYLWLSFTTLYCAQPQHVFEPWFDYLRTITYIIRK